jgi:hypothetical protein
MQTLRRGAFVRVGLVGFALGFVTLSALDALGQTSTPFVPYYGKNRVKYDNFDWHIYTTDHFEIYYYPAIEAHLERVASYAESAYQQISADLKHDLASKVPLVLYKTSSEFQQQNVIPEEVPEGVLAFAEPSRDRMVLPIDEPPDQLYRLITHELTHIFEFDIIPRSLIRRSLPLWVDEGLADYMTGYWNPLDLMAVRDAALADIVPKMSDFESEPFANGRLPYILGHAAFEFIESKWGKEGIRQFLFALRKSVIGGGENAYQEAFRLDPSDFDDQFDRYVKERFKPFRDKQRPADYGKNLAPKRDKTPFVSVLSLEPSPSGDLLAVAAGNRKDQELDLVLISAKTGEVIRTLTNGFDKDRGWEYIATPGGMRFNTVPWMSWAPAGDRLAYFVRTEKYKTLVIQNVVTRKVEARIEITSVDNPESPDFDPTGRYIVFSGLRNAVSDLFLLDLETREITNLTNDEFADYAPAFAPDGRSIVYMKRVSGNDKLFRLDLETREKRQLTFGTHDDAGPKFLDADTIVFASNATDPNQPVDPEVAKNGSIYNIWTLNLKTGELRQFTDVATGNVSPVPLRAGDQTRIAFVTYFKGEYGIYTIEPTQPVVTLAAADFGAPGPIIDFQAPLSHTLVAQNKRRKGTWEKLFLEGRPPVTVGVTSGRDVYGGTAVTFTDVLGDRQINLYYASISQYRTMAASLVNVSRRFQYALQGFSQTEFFYGLAGTFYDPAYAYLDRDFAIATRTVRGASGFGIYPLNRYARVELFGGVVQYREQFDDPALEAYSRYYQQQVYGAPIFRSGTVVPLGVNYVQETTVFREFGPLAGNTVKIGYEWAPKIGNTLSSHTADVDARSYLRLGTTGVLALRARAFTSWGDYPNFFYFGGNSEMRGYEYLEFIGNRGFFANAELRFPLIEAMATPIGVLGGVRGVLFFNLGAAGFNGQPLKLVSTATEIWPTIIGYVPNYETLQFDPVYGEPKLVSGFRLYDARASYGIGLETFALGFPIHFDWSWKTLFNRDWEDVVFALFGGSSTFRRPKFSMWIGYDF